LSPFYSFHQGGCVKPRWFLVSSLTGMCMTLARIQVDDLFSRQNKFAVCIFAVWSSLYCIYLSI